MPSCNIALFAGQTSVSSNVCRVFDAVVYTAVRRHLTKGQRAMATAMIYPEPSKAGRKKAGEEKNASIKEGFGDAHLSRARTVLAVMPELAKQLRDADAVSCLARLRRKPIAERMVGRKRTTFPNVSKQRMKRTCLRAKPRTRFEWPTCRRRCSRSRFDPKPAKRLFRGSNAHQLRTELTCDAFFRVPRYGDMGAKVIVAGGWGGGQGRARRRSKRTVILTVRISGQHWATATPL